MNETHSTASLVDCWNFSTLHQKSKFQLTEQNREEESFPFEQLHVSSVVRLAYALSQ
jgi:hypothetical protein